MNMDNVIGQKLERSHVIESPVIDLEARTVIMSVSSETPVARFFGTEILDHSKPESVVLGRLLDKGPLLLDHDPNKLVGVIEDAYLDTSKRKIYVKTRFGRSALAQEAFQDAVDGIRTKTSIGYIIHDIKEEKIDGKVVIRVTNFEIMEVSLVAIPADASVGLGRSQEQTFIGDTKMEKDNKAPVEDQIKSTPQVNIKEIAANARKAEMERIREIQAIGDKFEQRDLSRQFVENGKTVDEFRSAILEVMGKTTQKQVVSHTPAANIGMSEREVKKYSWIRAVRVVAFPNEKKFRDEAGYELECSRAAADLYGTQPQGIYIPADVLNKRDLSATAGSPFGPSGGFLVGDTHLASSFIDLLRNASVVQRAGATYLDGLVGNVEIPKMTGGATTYWISTEGGDATESDATFGQITLNPKTVGTYTEITRRLLLQSSPAVEGLVEADFRVAMALGIDKAALSGSGSSGQPRGVENTSGIGTVDLGGSPITNLSWDHIVDLETAVAVDNALLGNLSYITSPSVRGAMKKTVKETGTATFLWEGAGIDGTVNGYNAYATNQVVGAKVFFGNFRDVIIASWGGLDIISDPVSLSKSGGLRIVVLQSVDVAVRHAQSFALAS